jgi:hypothetical protein
MIEASMRTNQVSLDNVLFWSCYCPYHNPSAAAIHRCVLCPWAHDRRPVRTSVWHSQLCHRVGLSEQCAARALLLHFSAVVGMIGCFCSCLICRSCCIVTASSLLFNLNGFCSFPARAILERSLSVLLTCLACVQFNLLEHGMKVS